MWYVAHSPCFGFKAHRVCVDRDATVTTYIECSTCNFFSQRFIRAVLDWELESLCLFHLLIVVFENLY